MSFSSPAVAFALLSRRVPFHPPVPLPPHYVSPFAALILLRGRRAPAPILDTPAERLIGDIIEQTAIDFLDWEIDWSGHGLGDDTIAASSWHVTGTELILSMPSHTATTATIWISGGVEVGVYTITNTVTTADGRVIQKVFHCLIDA